MDCSVKDIQQMQQTCQFVLEKAELGRLTLQLG